MIKKILSLLIITFLSQGIGPLWANNAAGQGGASDETSTTASILLAYRDCPTCNKKKGPDHTPPDPVLLTGGKFFLPATDVNIPAKGGSSLRFDRSYSSQDGFQGVVGAGWVSNLDTALYYNVLYNQLSYSVQIEESLNPSGGLIYTLISASFSLHKWDGTVQNFVQSSVNPDIFTDGQYTIQVEPSSFGFIFNGQFYSTTNPTGPISFPDGAAITIRNQNGTLLSFGGEQPLSATIFTDGQYKVEKLSDGTFLFIYPSGDTYTFNAQGKPLYLKDPNGNAITYNYSGNLITSLSDASGRALTFAYNSSGQLTQMTDPLGRVWVYQRDTLNNLTSVTDSLGRTTKYAYQDALNPHSMTSVTDPIGYVTSYVYNNSDQVTKQTKPDGGTIQFTFNNLLGTSSMVDEFGKTWNFEYVLIGLTTMVIDPDGGVWQYTYDPNTNLMTSSTDPLGHKKTYAYDSEQNLTTLTDALGHQTQATYDPQYDWLTKTDANGHITTRVLDGNGNVLVLTDPAGKTATMAYDSNGQMISSTDKLGHTTTFVYDSYGNLIKKTDALGHSTTYAYDIAGRLTSLTDADNNTTKFTYDTGDRVTLINFPDGSSRKQTYDADDRMLTKTDGNGNVTSFTYGSPFITENVSKPLIITDALGNMTKFTYDFHANVLSTTDADGNTTNFEYGIFDRHIETTDALGKITTLSYDLAGNLTSVQDANGNVTRYAYDAMNRKLSSTDPLGNKTQYSYDPVDNLIQRIDANGKTTTYQFDTLDRETNINYPDLSGVLFQYDAQGNMIQRSGDYGVTNYLYDALNRQINISFPWANKSISYAYDAIGDKINSISDAGSIDYTYDSMKRLKTVTSLEGNVTSYNYDLGGRRTEAIYPNNLQAVYTYDADNRLTDLVNESSTKPKNTISSFTYTYDAVSNRLTMKDNAGKNTYTYDTLHRITSVNYAIGKTQTYTYDAAGNRLSLKDGKTTTNYAYDAANRLLSQGTDLYTYDANGNMLSDKDTSANTTTLYSYDFENRLRTAGPAANPNRNVYYYDAFGRRTGTDVNNKFYNSFYDGWQVLFETNVKAQVSKSFTYGAGIDEILSSKNKFYLYDGLGSVSDITDKSGASTDSYEYDAFGSVTSQTGTNNNSYLFTGRPLDSGTGFYYLRNRYYDPEIGRWLTPDPIGFRGGVNFYAYVNNNPVNMIDPFGLDGVSLGLPITMGLPSGAGCVSGERTGITQQDIDEADKEGYDVYWKYYQSDPMGNPINNPEGPYLTGKNQLTPPYGTDYSTAQDQLSLPNLPNNVGPVFVSRSETVAGPQTVAGNPLWETSGGGTEYYRGKSYFPTTREPFN